MALDFTQLKFIGLVGKIAEKEFSASTALGQDLRFGLAILEAYHADGFPSKPAAWIRKRLASEFLCV